MENEMKKMMVEMKPHMKAMQVTMDKMEQMISKKSMAMPDMPKKSMAKMNIQGLASKMGLKHK